MKFLLFCVGCLLLAVQLRSEFSVEQLLGRKENLNGVEHVDFENTCKTEAKNDINVAVSSLHSFEYSLALKEWRKVIEKDVRTFFLKNFFSQTVQLLIGYFSLKKFIL
jgi:hypothetical protein